MQRSARLGLFAVLFLFAVPAARGTDAEFYVNTYRSIGAVSPMGARSVAMGRTGRGLADGVDSLGVNPAALGAFAGTAFDADLGLDWLDDGYDNTDQVTFKVGGAVNLDRWSTSAGPNQSLGALLHTQGYSGAGGVGMKRSQTAFLAGYGLQLMDDLLGGVSVALYDGKWQADAGAFGSNIDRSFTGGDFKVGGIYRVRDETTVGGTLGYSIGSLKDKGAYAANAGSGSLDRFSLGVGVAHQYTDETLLMGDLRYERTKSKIPGVMNESNTSWGLSVGVEQQILPEVMALRGGLYYDRASYSGSAGGMPFVGTGSFSKGRFGFTAGVGVKLYNFDLGYSLDVNSGGDVKNLLDFSTTW
jgi:hypothetical protein